MIEVHYGISVPWVHCAHWQRAQQLALAVQMQNGPVERVLLVWVLPALVARIEVPPQAEHVHHSRATSEARKPSL